MTLRKVRLIVLAALAFPAAGVAQVPLGSRAAVGPGETVTWDAVGPGWVPLVSPVEFFAGLLKVSVSTTAPGFRKYVAGTNWIGGFTDGDALLFNEGGRDMTFSFSAPVNAFAIQLWHNYALNGVVTLEAMREGKSIGSYARTVYGGSGANLDQAPVLGFAFDGGFDAVTLTSAQHFGEFAVDEATLAFVAPEDPAARGIAAFGDAALVGVTATPEPATFVLLATGLLGIAACAAAARKRR